MHLYIGHFQDSHILSQREAFQGDILPSQSGGVGELDFKISGVFPDGTWEEQQETRAVIQVPQSALAATSAAECLIHLVLYFLFSPLHIPS